MAVSYMKLWHLLLDRGLKKVDLERISGISHYTTKRMTRNLSIPKGRSGETPLSQELCTIPRTSKASALA